MNSCKPSIGDFVEQAKIDAEALRKTNGAETDDRPAPEIPGYQVQSTINRGGQSVVYRAVRQSAGLDLAIKVLRTGRRASAEGKARFDREIELLQSLNHSGIAKIFDTGTIDEQIYLVVAA